LIFDNIYVVVTVIYILSSHLCTVCFSFSHAARWRTDDAAEMNNSPRLKMCDDTRSAENDEVVGEHMRPNSTLPICKPTEQCKCNNGSFVYTCPFTPYGHASMLAIVVNQRLLQASPHMHRHCRSSSMSWTHIFTSHV